MNVDFILSNSAFLKIIEIQKYVIDYLIFDNDNSVISFVFCF